MSLGLQNDGSLTVDPSGTSGDPGLTLEGPIMNTGTLTVNGTVAPWQYDLHGDDQ